MKKPFFFAVALFQFANAVQAHTHLEKTMPADNSVLKAAPKEIMLHFSATTRLTALSIQKEGDKERPLKPLPTAVAKAIAVPVPALAPGKYVVDWRVVGDDGHVVSGKFHFTVDAQ